MSENVSNGAFQSAFISIIGRPNAGKSTLANRLVGEKIAIISDKPQTTRHNIIGVVNGPDCQFILTDTPGIHAPKTVLGEYMMRSASQALSGADAVLFLVEPVARIGKPEEKILADLKKSDLPSILALNKIDAVQKEALLPVIALYAEAYAFDEILPLSAKTGDGVGLLREKLKKYLQPGPRFYPADMTTDQSDARLCAEIIREKLLRALDKEVPHGLAVELTQMTEKEKIVEIQATVYCEKDSHKGIVVGKGGAALKAVGSKAREDMEALLKKKVFLELWAKVNPDWRNKNKFVRDFGFSVE
jgi:GTP-binding protein Era